MINPLVLACLLCLSPAWVTKHLMSGFTGFINYIVGNTETLGKKTDEKTKFTVYRGNIDSVYITRGITLRLSEKQNWRGNKICCLPREYWLSVHNLKDNALCTTVRKPVWFVRFMSYSVRVKGLRDRMTFKYFLHFFSRLRSASRFSFRVHFTITAELNISNK